MESLVEQQRSALEEMERLEDVLADVLVDESSNQRQIMSREHRALEILKRVDARSSFLVKSLKEDGDVKQSELAALNKPQKPSEQLKLFYHKLDNLKAFHTKHTEGPQSSLDLEMDTFFSMEAEEDILNHTFSAKEAYGKYLDLQAMYASFVSFTKGQCVNYARYILSFDHLEAITLSERRSAAYMVYVTELLAYLEGFWTRTHPLKSVETVVDRYKTDFEKTWADGGLDPWQKEQEGIYCDLCEKLYSKQTVYDAHLTSKKHVKEQQKQKAANGDATSSKALREQKDKMIAATEYMIQCWGKRLMDIRQATKIEIERQASLTAREREQEAEEAEIPPEQAVDVQALIVADPDEDKVYNPLKLPLGWDGRPIPYWLYKLHGLGTKLECEICSGAIYEGRKAFDAHFGESKHTAGMKMLGLPNTRHFYQITKVEEALMLAEKLRRQGQAQLLLGEDIEEVEDEQGNVYGRKTYEDLKKQGLI